jgi:hypothetical protein
MSAAALTSSAAPALLAELHYADHIIKAMLNAMTGQQKAKVHKQLAAAGVSGDGMTRANERLSVIEAVSVTSQEQRILTAFQTMDLRRKTEALFYMEEIAIEFPSEAISLTGGDA